MKRLVFVSLVVSLIGCVPSLHGLFSDARGVDMPALVGVWKTTDSDDYWEFRKVKKAGKDDETIVVTRTASKEYQAVMVEDGKTGRFELRVVKLGSQFFLDLTPQTSRLLDRTFHESHFIPVHTFMRVERFEPTLRLTALNRAWLEEFLRKNPKALEHSRVGGDIILTEETEGLQAFFSSTKAQKAFFAPKDLTSP